MSIPHWLSHQDDSVNVKDPEETPERTLWRMVLWTAIRDALTFHQNSSATTRTSLNVIQARQWIQSYNEDFKSVCEFAGVDPDYMRRKLSKMIHDKVPIKDIDWSRGDVISM